MKHYRGLTVSSLTQYSSRTIIKSIVDDQISIIDSKINTAHQAGFNSITHLLPTNFNINNMDKSDSQLFIYSEIVDIYTRPEAEGGKGFADCSIDINNKPTLFIRWPNGLQNDERALRLGILRRHAGEFKA